MIAFATLLLGLVAGEVRLDLLVAANVATVELRVDGALCARLTSPPWSAWCDLGETPAPRRLVAIARGADGAELGRVEQRINFDFRDADLSLLVDGDPASGSALLHIAAASPEATAPNDVAVTIDGRPIPARDPSVVPLPRLDLAEPHLIRVEARWSERVEATAEAVLGGEFGARLATELTAVPIRVRGRRSPKPEELAGGARRRGEALRVAAVDRGPGELWLVADPDRLPEVARHVARARVPAVRPGQLPDASDPRGRPTVGGVDWRFVGRLGEDDRLRLVWPWPERRASGGRDYELFLPSPPLSLRDGLPWLLYHARLPARVDGAPRLADAVAVAGLTVAGTERRRAVLLLLGERDADSSRLTPAAARGYLASLRVPLHVWRLAAAASGDDPWASRPVSSPRQLQAALRDLSDDLASQRIAWLEGAHLPHEIEIEAAWGGNSLALAPERNAIEAVPPRGPSEIDDADLAADERSLASAIAAATGARRRAASRAVGTDARQADVAGLALRAEARVEIDLAPFAKELRDAVASWSASTGLAPPDLGGAEVVIVERLADHPELTRAAPVAGARGNAAFGVAVVERDGRPAEIVAALARHELAHLLAERAWPRPLPVWLEEGLAEQLARFDADPEARRRRGVVERVVEAGGVRTRASGPLADLLTLARDAERGALPALAEWTALSWREFVAPERRARHYALAGELAEFLLFAEPSRAARLRAALGRAARDPTLDLDVEIAAALGDAAALDAAFRAWLVAERGRALAAASGP
jgi:hypothetical protein